MSVEPKDVDWREVNRANWDERVEIHLASEAYDLAPLRAGNATLHPIDRRDADAREHDGLAVADACRGLGRRDRGL